MQQRNRRTIAAAIIAGLCSIAGVLATVLPDGEVQRGAEKVANACEAGGIRAYPEDVAAPPAAVEDAGTALPSPTHDAPPPGLPGAQRAELGAPPTSARWSQPVRRWTWLAASERWPGETRGWM